MNPIQEEALSVYLQIRLLFRYIFKWSPTGIIMLSTYGCAVGAEVSRGCPNAVLDPRLTSMSTGSENNALK